MILSIATKALGLEQSDGSVVRIGIIKFWSHQDLPMVLTHGFAPNINTIVAWLNTQQPDGGSRDGYEAVGKKNDFQLLFKSLLNFLLLATMTFIYHYCDARHSYVFYRVCVDPSKY